MEKRLGSGKTGATKRISRFAEPRARWRLLLKTETLGPCKILAHIPLKKKSGRRAPAFPTHRSKIRSTCFRDRGIVSSPFGIDAFE